MDFETNGFLFPLDGVSIEGDRDVTFLKVSPEEAAGHWTPIPGGQLEFQHLDGFVLLCTGTQNELTHEEPARLELKLQFGAAASEFELVVDFDECHLTWHDVVTQAVRRGVDMAPTTGTNMGIQVWLSQLLGSLSTLRVRVEFQPLEELPVISLEMRTVIGSRVYLHTVQLDELYVVNFFHWIGRKQFAETSDRWRDSHLPMGQDYRPEKPSS